jgi:hypothetical protein
VSWEWDNSIKKKFNVKGWNLKKKILIEKEEEKKQIIIPMNSALWGEVQ